ncbi:MAG: hypothetical protein KAT58_00920 [candidate division Zixibacteria bacterium]|nr:hypothetical protein [candidate division Zixibacteria bacterium]
MGRVDWPKKTVEQCLVFSIFDLKRMGVLGFLPDRLLTASWKDGSGQVTSSICYRILEDFSGIELIYTLTPGYGESEKEQIRYTVPLETTPCNFGGVRYWFTCPLYRGGTFCGRRVANLYKPPGAKYFGCRHCYDLSYKSRQMTRGWFYWLFTKPFEYQSGKRKAGRSGIRELRDLIRMQEHLEKLENRNKRREKRKT